MPRGLRRRAAASSSAPGHPGAQPDARHDRPPLAQARNSGSPSCPPAAAPGQDATPHALSPRQAENRPVRRPVRSGHSSLSCADAPTTSPDGESYLISGNKKWIGNGSIADVVVVWARDTSDGAVMGFLIEKGTPGYHARVMEGKASLRAVWQAEIRLDAVRVPAENRLPGANSFRDCAAVLTGTRSACAWMALGHAVSGFDAALTYAKRRKQFGKPLASFQIIQQRLVRMLADVTAMQLYCVQIAKLEAAGKLAPTLAGLAKLHNTSKARVVLADARDLLGGNGILLDFHGIRHMADIESIHTFEGTETIQTLIVGRDITGISAFTA